MPATGERGYDPQTDSSYFFVLSSPFKPPPPFSPKAETLLPSPPPEDHYPQLSPKFPSTKKKKKNNNKKNKNKNKNKTSNQGKPTNIPQKNNKITKRK